MKITHVEIPVKDLYENYHPLESEDEGIYAYDNQLTIRPKYQREFIYSIEKQRAVIDTALNHYPLNTIYWARIPGNRDAGLPEFELLDGQQRILSILRYLTGMFGVAIDPRKKDNLLYYNNLPINLQQQILDYKLQVYICEGSESERLAWFKRINISGEPVNEQELLNATYTGPWLEDAKDYFSRGRNNAIASSAAGYVRGVANRQDYLATALKWIAHRDATTVQEYMAKNQSKKTATPLKNYFNGVIEWAKATFPIERSQLSNVNWGALFNEHGTKDLDPQELEAQIKTLMADDDVTHKVGIYSYVLDPNPKYLNIRAFTESQKTTLYERQQGICPHCKNKFEKREMEADHITPWIKGGKTELSNGQMLCKSCNRTKSST